MRGHRRSGRRSPFGSDKWSHRRSDRWSGDWADNRSDRRSGRRLYRSRNGRIFGVCKGLAEYFDLSVRGVRIAAVVLLIMTGFWPIVLVYAVAALIMKPEPVAPLKDEYEEEFYDSYVNSRAGAINRLKQVFDRLDRRIRRMEDIVTQREYDWDRRFNNP